MKIDVKNTTPNPGVAAPGTVRGEPPVPPQGVPGRTDRVSVSDLARELVGLRSDLETVRKEKVAGLRAVMAKGQYSADFPKVAEALLREVLTDLLA